MRELCMGAFAVLLFVPLMSGVAGRSARAQSGSVAPASARQIGTVQSIDADTLTLLNDKGEQMTISMAAETKVVQLPAGSTDLKAAQPAAIADLSVGDRVLAIGAPGATAASLTARRLVLMKSTDISKRHETEQAGWQHGSGGIVSAIDPATGSITLAAGARTVAIATGPSTIFRRYAPTSARFEDASRSTLAGLHTGDQLRVRGERADDGSIKADEIVSGAFRHLSGTILAVNATANQLSVRDLKTKKPVTLSITPGTAIHELPEEVATRFAARAKSAPGAGGAKAAPAAATPAAAETASSTHETGAPHAGGGDLSQIVARLPAATLANLKAGDAVMVVGTDGDAGMIAALTVLGGVEPILAASPSGGAEMALSPWSMGGGEAAGGSAQ